MCIIRALEVDRLQRRRDLAAGEDREARLQMGAKVSAQLNSPLPMEFHSSSYRSMTCFIKRQVLILKNQNS